MHDTLSLRKESENQAIIRICYSIGIGTAFSIHQQKRYGLEIESVKE
jgi:hypothetical protein